MDTFTLVYSLDSLYLQSFAVFLTVFFAAVSVFAQEAITSTCNIIS